MPKRPITANDLLTLQFVGDPQISPDGRIVLFSKKQVGGKNNYETNLFSVDDTGAVRQWTSSGKDGHGRWSPDGTHIAFISSREKKKPQIFLMRTDGGEAVALTKLPEGSIEGFRWSPDGSKIAFSFREEHSDWTQEAEESRKDSGSSTPPRIMEDAWYRLDGDGFFGPQRFALYVVDIATGDTTKIYDKAPNGWFSYDWSPDSLELAVTHSVNKNMWSEKPNDQIFRVTLDGQAWMLEGLPKGEKSSIRWSPNGEWLAYLGDHSDDDPWGIRNVKLYVTPAGGGAVKCLSDGDDYCLTVMTLSDAKDASSDGVLEWSPDGKAIYLSVGWHGSVQLGYVEIEKGRVEMLTSGNQVVTVGNLSKSGEKFGCLWCDALHPNEVGIYDLNQHPTRPNVLTTFNDSWVDSIKLSEPEELWLESPDGAKVHTWCMKPIDYLEPRRYPAVLEIHGGPHAQYGWALFHEFQLLAANGYVVVFSNPRGSKGYGEAHTAAIRGSWGDRDWEDIQTVLRWMQHQPFIHPGQIGVMGGSYGGYMTNWAVGHTNDFRAAITDRCVSNLVSMAGNCDFPINKDGYWSGYAWGDIDSIKSLWEQSPIAYFDKVETPMLIIHSEGDLRCNVEQAEQVFTALQVRGIESRFVRYPRETSHGMSRSGPPDLRLHRLGEIVAWWEKHLK